jgi:hypothetical protein
MANIDLGLDEDALVRFVEDVLKTTVQEADLASKTVVLHLAGAVLKTTEKKPE